MSEELEPPLTDEALCRLSAVMAPIPAMLPRPPEHADNPARWMFERLATYIKQFESTLSCEVCWINWTGSPLSFLP